jgi:hypothetical protein
MMVGYPADLPTDIRRRVMVDNTVELYGERLLAPNA